MRTTGFAPTFVAMLVSAQLTLASVPAFAEPPPPAAAPAPAPAASTDGTVIVHINSPTPVTLQKRSAPSAAWETVCTSPCDQRASVSDQYRVVGEGGATPSKHFHLDSAKGTATLDVTPGDPKKKTTGLIVVGVAGVLTTAGIITIIAGSKPSNAFRADGTTGLSNTNVLFIGTALIVAGAATGIYGAAMIINNGKSDVEGDVSRTGPARGNIDVPTKTAQIPAQSVPQFVFPVFSGTF
jgi:hypothetical protein